MKKNLTPPDIGLTDAKSILKSKIKSASKSDIIVPWEKQKDTFFSPVEIDGKRWDQLYPYRLLVVDVHKGNSIVSKRGAATPKMQGPSPSNDKFQISFDQIGGSWEFRLPITPQQLSIHTIFATQSSATLKGLVEEHNGVRFKIISASGSFGLWPYKPNKAATPGAPNILETLFAGTIQAANNLVGQVRRVVNTIKGEHPAGKRSVIKPEDSNTGIASTGYAYAILLDQFLEQYAEAKKNPDNAGWRLVFDIPKQNRAFVVTPQMFEWSQSIENPNEIKYRLQFKAWRKIDVQSVFPSPPPTLQAITPNFLQRLLNGLDEARRTAASAINLIQAVRGDFQTPLNILRQMTLFVKDLAGVTQSVAELPRQIINDYKNEIKLASRTLSESARILRGINFSSVKVIGALAKIQASLSMSEGLGSSQAAFSVLGGNSSISALTDPSNEIFENPEEYYELFSSIPINQLTITPEQQEAIDNEVANVQSMTVDELIQNTNQLMELANQIADLYGAGDPVYSEIYDKPPPYVRLQEMTIDEFDFLNKLYEVIQLMEILTATQELDDGRIQSAIEYVGALAAESNIPYETPASKIIVPVPFGLSIEQIAARYLGNPDRWIEIATLNALKSPYIDETGFERYLLSNADGRSFNIASAEHLYVNQIITIISDNQPRTMRRIISIEKINETNYLITVDGLDNLSVYTVAHNARIKAYMPGTVNSQNQIFIPADIPAPDDVRSRPIPIFKSDPLVGLSKVDLLLTDSGDIAMDNYKEIKMAGGVQNLIQALKLKFATPLRSLIKHPEYGAAVTVGDSTAEFTATEIYNKIFDAVTADGRFSGIQNLTVTLDGPVLSISLSAIIANGNGVLPISFKVG